MERLIASKFQTDVVVDSSIAAISGLLIRTPFISLPVYMCTALLPKRSQWLVSALLKMVAFFQVAISMRKIAVQKGVHNAVGTPSKYVVAAITFLRMRTHQIMAKRREKLKKVYGSNDHSKAEQKTSEVCMVNMPAVDQMESVWTSTRYPAQNKSKGKAGRRGVYVCTAHSMYIQLQNTQKLLWWYCICTKCIHLNYI